MPLYTVQRSRKNDALYGPIHASHTSDCTLCGKLIDGTWFILTNNGAGKLTCKACAAALKPIAKD